MTSTGEPLLSEQVRALEDGAGLCPRDDLVALEVGGADRVEYLHRMLTQDLAALAPGQAAYACLLTIKGRILGDLMLWHLRDALLLETDAAALDGVRSTLEKYVIADDVRFAGAAARSRFALVGPSASDVLGRVGLDVPAHGDVLESRAEDGSAVSILRFDRRGLVCFELAAAPAAASALRQTLLESGGVTACGSEAWAAACVRRGIPTFGRELGEDVLFNEAELEESVSWRKGCFPGQEPVLKAKHRGQAPRRLVRLTLDSQRRPAPGTALLYDGRAVGHITSWAPALGDSGPMALAYVRRALAEPGTELEIEGGTGRVES